MLSFALSSYVFYSVTPYFMRISSALLFVLSLLTADIYSFICGLFIFDYKVDISLTPVHFHLLTLLMQFSALYCVSFAVIATGLVVYNLKPTHIKTNANFDADISTTSTRSGGQ